MESKKKKNEGLKARSRSQITYKALKREKENKKF